MKYEVGSGVGANVNQANVNQGPVEAQVASGKVEEGQGEPRLSRRDKDRAIREIAILKRDCLDPKEASCEESFMVTFGILADYAFNPMFKEARFKAWYALIYIEWKAIQAKDVSKLAIIGRLFDSAKTSPDQGRAEACFEFLKERERVLEGDREGRVALKLVEDIKTIERYCLDPRGDRELKRKFVFNLCMFAFHSSFRKVNDEASEALNTLIEKDLNMVAFMAEGVAKLESMEDPRISLAVAAFYLKREDVVASAKL